MTHIMGYIYICIVISIYTRTINKDGVFTCVVQNICGQIAFSYCLHSPFLLVLFSILRDLLISWCLMFLVVADLDRVQK